MPLKSDAAQDEVPEDDEVRLQGDVLGRPEPEIVATPCPSRMIQAPALPERESVKNV